MATSDSGQALKGAWLVGIMLILYVVGGIGGLYLSDLSFFRSPQGPGADPPFYFIRRDLIVGFSYGLTGLLSVALGIYYRKRYPYYAWMAIWMTVLWSGYHFAKSMVIVFKTTHLFTPAQSTSSWLTFSDYMYDPLIICAQVGMAFLSLAIVFLTRNKIKPA